VHNFASNKRFLFLDLHVVLEWVSYVRVSVDNVFWSLVGSVCGSGVGSDVGLDVGSDVSHFVVLYHPSVFHLCQPAQLCFSQMISFVDLHTVLEWVRMLE
jgi:hypothetical protein